MTITPVITLDHVSFSYGGPLVLEHVDLTITEGEFLGLVGPNGSGKSTLLKVILGLLTPASGRITVMGQDPADARDFIGYVPQFGTFVPGFPISVEETVLMGRLGKTRMMGGYRSEDRTLAHQAMVDAGILDIRNRPLEKLSGGQLQRVLIARALVIKPEILLLDEPTSNVDLRAEEDIFELLKHLNEHMTIIVVSHDIGFISQYITHVACLNRTLLCHQTAALTSDVIEQLYGRPVRVIRHESHHHPGTNS